MRCQAVTMSGARAQVAWMLRRPGGQAGPGSVAQLASHLGNVSLFDPAAASAMQVAAGTHRRAARRSRRAVGTNHRA
jgi:hypothetical protein